MASLKGKRIFYIEDDVKNRVIVTIILEQAGAKVWFERWGGPEVITRLKASLPIDVILCDLMFPQNITGYDVFDHIRQDPELATIPVIAVSSADPTVEMPKLKAKGFAGFIGKPVSMMTLPNHIARVLDGEQVWVAS